MKNKSIKSVILSTLLILFAGFSFAQTWPCAQYITRQVPNGSSFETNISYVYDLGVIPVTVTVAKVDTLLNASVIYNGNIWAWKQYTGTAQSGSAGARLIKVNYNGLDSTVTPTLTGYNFPTITFGCNAAFVDPNGIYYVIDTATSGASYFVLSRINLTTATPTLLSNLKVNLPNGSTVASGGLGDLVYRNDSVFALVNNTGLFRFALPSLSTTSVTTNLVGGSINRTIGSLFAINSDLNNIYGYGSANAATTQDRLLKISTQTGVVTELTLSGTSVSQSDGAGCPSSNFSQPIFLNISGNVFDDVNGLTDNIVNGTGTNAGGVLYAQLLDATSAVEATIPVASNGTYTFTGLTPGAYTVLINNSSTASTSTTLPSNWVNTGEYNAIIAGSAGSDGNINGKSTPVILTLTNVANVNFGIEQLPVSDNKTYNIVAPAVNTSITLDGTGMVPGPLSGSDPEDGILGINKTLIITTVPTNSLLYYNGTLIANNTTINNYDPSKLQIKFITMGALNTSFQYSFLDAANNQNVTHATYFITWASVLPVVLTSFNAEKENDYAVLKWTTGSELNVKVFNVERSVDNGTSWEPVGEVVATGNSSEKQDYSFTDANPENGTNLYRLQIEDNNGSTTYSKTTQIETEAASSMTVYPNPVGEDEALNIQLVGLKPGSYKISMVSASGQTVKGMTFNVSNTGSALLVIPTGNLTRGSYVVIVNGNNQQYSKTVVVANR